MADTSTKLYATQGNGGEPGVTIGQIAAIVTSGAQAAAVANCTVATDGTSAGTQLNALLASLRAAGTLAT